MRTELFSSEALGVFPQGFALLACPPWLLVSPSTLAQSHRGEAGIESFLCAGLLCHSHLGTLLVCRLFHFSGLLWLHHCPMSTVLQGTDQDAECGHQSLVSSHSASIRGRLLSAGQWTEMVRPDPKREARVTTILIWCPEIKLGCPEM